MKPLTPEQKQRRVEAVQRWAVKHPEKVAEYKRRWRERYPDRQQAAREAWRASKPVEELRVYLREKAQAWRVAHPERVREIQRQYRTRHRPRSTGPKRRLTDDEKTMIEQLHMQALTFKDIGLRLGRPDGQTVARYLRSLKPIRRRPVKSGPGATNWKGGRHFHHSGYWFVWIPPDDPMASMRSRSGRVAEHRLVLARVLGRPLLDSETVHHINGDRADNAPENLQLRHGRHGNGIAFICLDCGSHRIGPAPLGSRRD